MQLNFLFISHAFQETFQKRVLEIFVMIFFRKSHERQVGATALVTAHHADDPELKRF